LLGRSHREGGAVFFVSLGECRRRRRRRRHCYSSEGKNGKKGKRREPRVGVEELAVSAPRQSAKKKGGARPLCTVLVVSRALFNLFEFGCGARCLWAEMCEGLRGTLGGWCVSHEDSGVFFFCTLYFFYCLCLSAA